MDKPRIAYVHIGMPKTGTTAIQESLADARETLSANGLVFLGAADHNMLLSRYHVTGPDHYYMRQKKIPAKAAEAACVKLFKEMAKISAEGSKDVLVSSEYLYAMRREAVERLDADCRAAGFELRLVCYVRHPISSANSIAQQALKKGRMSFAEVEAEPRFHSFSTTLAAPLRVLGRDRMIICRFDDAKAMGSQRHILSAIGYRGDESEIPVVEANSSLSMTGACLADAHVRRVRADQTIPQERSYLLSIAGTPYRLPRAMQERVAEAAGPELAWLRRQFGIELAEPSIVDGVKSLTPQEADSILELIVAPRPVGLKRRLRRLGLLPKPRKR